MKQLQFAPAIIALCLFGGAAALPHTVKASNAAIADEGLDRIQVLLEKYLDAVLQQDDEDSATDDGEEEEDSDDDEDDSAHASLLTPCIEALRVLIDTGNVKNAGFSRGTHHIVLSLTNGDEVRRDLEHTVRKNKPYAKDFDDLQCISRSEISQVYLEAGTSDGWFIAQIITQAKYQNQSDYAPLTSDIVFNKWLDGDQTRKHYDPKHLPLNLLVESCSSDFQISGTTADASKSGFTGKHYIVFHLTDGEEKVEINGDSAKRNEPFTIDIPTERCIQFCDIKQVSLDAGNSDGWKIADITTSYFDSASSSYVVLTKDSVFDKWVDTNQPNLSYDATHVLLSFWWPDPGV